jgi:predicted outer membrane lipoprotein
MPISKGRARLTWNPPCDHALGGALAFAHGVIVVARLEHDEAGTARNGRHDADVAAGAAPINGDHARRGAVGGLAEGRPIARDPKFAPLLVVVDAEIGREPATAPILRRTLFRTIVGMRLACAIARTRNGWRRREHGGHKNCENAMHVV